MITYNTKLTDTEKALIDDIKDLQYGEIEEVELDGDGRPQFIAELTRQQNDLVKLIRSGIQSFLTIKIHMSDPTYAIVPGQTRSGRWKCKKLYKFN